MLKDRYVYPAIFDFNSNKIEVTFPDFPGSGASGLTGFEEALDHAKMALGFTLYGMENDGEGIPEPSDICSIECSKGQTVVLVDVWMIPYIEDSRTRSVNTTVTLPKWLKEVANNHKLNFSELLQMAIKNELGIEYPRTDREE